MPRVNMESGSGDASNLADLLKRMREAAADRSRPREGELVRDHPSPRQLISTFMVTLREMASLGDVGKFEVATSTQVPDAYPPCLRSASELQPLMISDMRLQTHHRGKKTLLRVLTPPSRMTAVMAIVEDEQGTAVLLQLYYQPDEATLPAHEIVHVDRICIVKEAFFKFATDGSYTLRVDHVSDIIWLDESDERVPLKWKKPPLTTKSVSLRMQGNSAVAKQNWAGAQRL